MTHPADGGRLVAYCLCEWTLPSFVWQALAGRRPTVLAIEPILPPSRWLLDRVARWATATGRARPVVDLCPDLEPLIQYPTRVLLHDVFGQLEPWHDEHYRYEDIDRDCPRLAYVYRQITSNHVRWKHHTLLLIQRLHDAHPGIEIVGSSPDTAAMAKAYCGVTVKPRRLPPHPVNVLVWLALTTVALAGMVTRIRWRVPPENFFFAADFLSDPRDYELYEEAAEGGPVLLVPRDSSHTPPAFLAARHRVASSRDGRLTMRAAASLLPLVMAEAWAVLRHFPHLDPSHFWALAALPWRRVLLRAFFSRFRPRHFWGRDDYNVEHIIRRQEIHRIGGTSLGVNHGYPAYSVLFPMWRYISFDRYYAFGTALYDRYMKSSWAADMQVVPAGTFGASRAQYAIRLMERPQDIVVFAAVMVGDPAMVAFVRSLAQAFPDRKVLLQVKSTFINLPEGRHFVAECVAGLENVVPVRDGMFDLFAKARYSFSDPSTVVVEAVQFGLYSFNVDICPVQKVSLLREYPDLCVRSAEDAIDRIAGIESGRWRYPREKFADLIDLSGRVFHDIVREDLGLPAREPARLLPDLPQGKPPC